MSILRITKKFSQILTGHQKLRIFELAVLMVIGGFLEMFSVSLVLPFMDAVMQPETTMEKWYVRWVCELLDLHSPRTFLVAMALALAVVYIAKNVYLLLEFNVQYRFVYGNMLAMQRRVLRSYINRPYEYFLKVSSGEIIQVITGNVPHAFSLLQSLLAMFTELIVSGMLIAVVFVVAPLPTITIAAVLLLLLVAINFFIKPVLRKAGLSQQNAGMGMNKWLIQSIQGIKELKIMGKEEFFQNNFDVYGTTYVNSLRKNQILGVIPRFFIEALSMSTMFFIVAALIYRGNDLETIIPMLTAVAMAAIRLLPSVNRISQGLAGIAYYEPMLDKLIENLRELGDGEKVSLDPNGMDWTDVEKQANLSSFQDTIELHSISFRYPEGENDVLSDAGLTIQKGESVGIVGASGAGKTTAVDILLGLLHPQQGQVLVDGIDIADDIRGWHDQIGYIPQMIFMLDDTIRNNICFGEEARSVSDDKVWRALEDASLAEFVRSLPEGLDTEIGERGVRLSGGQRQRTGAVPRPQYFGI